MDGVEAGDEYGCAGLGRDMGLSLLDQMVVETKVLLIHVWVFNPNKVRRFSNRFRQTDKQNNGQRAYKRDSVAE